MFSLLNVCVPDIVRGSLCSAIKQILEQGLKKASILGGPVHPWQFIQVKNVNFRIILKLNTYGSSQYWNTLSRLNTLKKELLSKMCCRTVEKAKDILKN